MYDLHDFMRRQTPFSVATFGPGTRTRGLCDHIRKEVDEIEREPRDIAEWVDVFLLTLDGVWRHGFTPEEFTAAVEAKFAKNQRRTWPDWRVVGQDKAICHVRGEHD